VVLAPDSSKTLALFWSGNAALGNFEAFVCWDPETYSWQAPIDTWLITLAFLDVKLLLPILIMKIPLGFGLRFSSAFPILLEACKPPQCDQQHGYAPDIIFVRPIASHEGKDLDQRKIIAQAHSAN